MSNALSREEHELLSTRGAALLQRAGLGDHFRFERLSGGRNNRVYRVTAGDAAVVLKWYFRHANDQRDRLNAEYRFCEYAIDCGATCVAKPLGRDDLSQLAAYSLLEGQRLATGQVEPSHTQQAIAFLRLLNDSSSKFVADKFVADAASVRQQMPAIADADAGSVGHVDANLELLNAQRTSPIAERLPVASEACFSLDEHIDCVTARVARVNNIAPSTEHHRAALELVDAVIAPALARSVNQLKEWASKSEFSMNETLTAEQRCISPSDFGFHNALLHADGRLSFLDFEYAGWDDPAKLLCDFFCQPEVPAPRETWQEFADLTAALAGDTELERQRQALLLPLYQVKWCCILLNEFVATAGQRRKFAEQQPADLALQLEKAKRLAEQLSRRR